MLSDVTGTSLDKGDELDALGTLPENEQRKLADRTKNGEKVSAKAHAKKIKRDARERALGRRLDRLALTQPHAEDRVGRMRRALEGVADAPADSAVILGARVRDIARPLGNMTPRDHCSRSSSRSCSAAIIRRYRLNLEASECRFRA